MIYQWRYPNSVDRSVMVGVNPPGNFIYSGAEIDQGIEHYSALCAQQPACRARTKNLAASVQHTAADMPSSWFSLPIKPGNVLVGTFLGLTEANDSGSPLTGPMTLNSWISAAQGDPSGLWFLSAMANLVLPQSFVWGEFASIGMADAQPVERYFSSGADRGSIIGNPLGEFLWGAGGLVHAWPANPGENQYTSVQNSNVPTLLIGGTLDFETPAQNATKELLPHLSNGHQVIVSGLGHVDDFDAYEPKASTQLLTTFYATGQVDTSRYTPNEVSFATADTQAAIAKKILATMVAVALVAVIWLVVLAIRIRRRGGTGRKTGAWIRSAGPLVFGLGGWFLGALLILRFWLWPNRAARRPAAGSCLNRGADLARGLRRLGPHRHVEGDAAQGHRCRGCRCAGRGLTRVPRDQWAHGVDHDDHRCGGRVQSEPPRARHLDRAGRLPGNGRSGGGSVGDGATGDGAAGVGPALIARTVSGNPWRIPRHVRVRWRVNGSSRAAPRFPDPSSATRPNSVPNTSVCLSQSCLTRLGVEPSRRVPRSGCSGQGTVAWNRADPALLGGLNIGVPLSGPATSNRRFRADDVGWLAEERDRRQETRPPSAVHCESLPIGPGVPVRGNPTPFGRDLT